MNHQISVTQGIIQIFARQVQIIFFKIIQRFIPSRIRQTFSPLPTAPSKPRQPSSACPIPTSNTKKPFRIQPSARHPRNSPIVVQPSMPPSRAVNGRGPHLRRQADDLRTRNIRRIADDQIESAFQIIVKIIKFNQPHPVFLPEAVGHFPPPLPKLPSICRPRFPQAGDNRPAGSKQAAEPTPIPAPKTAYVHRDQRR